MSEEETVEGKIIMAGDIKSPGGDGLPRCVIVQFDSEEQVRKAVKKGQIKAENHLGKGADNE